MSFDPSVVFQIMGVFAEFERAMIRERVLSGLERAKTITHSCDVRRNDLGAFSPDHTAHRGPALSPATRCSQHQSCATPR